MTPFVRVIGTREGLYNFDTGGHKVWLTAIGEERAEPPFRHPRPTGVRDCGHGVRIVDRDGQWGIIDADGRDVIAPAYRAIACFKNGVAWAPIDSRRQWCALGPDGIVRANNCTTLRYPYYATHAAPQEFHSDPFENSVLWTRAFLEFDAGRRDTPPLWIPWREGPTSTFR